MFSPEKYKYIKHCTFPLNKDPFLFPTKSRRRFSQRMYRTSNKFGSKKSPDKGSEGRLSSLVAGIDGCVHPVVKALFSLSLGRSLQINLSEFGTWPYGVSARLSATSATVLYARAPQTGSVRKPLSPGVFQGK